MASGPELPSEILRLAEACAQGGGRLWLVGGWVRDLLLGSPSKDFDLEVHGIGPDGLEAILRRLGKVNKVGRSFGVYKLSVQGLDLDVSIPRKDSKVGPGHKGILAEGDPHLGLVEAARRRDLTINSMAFDPLTHQISDPFGGEKDLQSRLLRAVDPATFGEDPLRALRVVQFAARFEFAVDPELHALCAAMPLGDLPPERVWLELEKLLLKARRPSLGVVLAEGMGILARVLPELSPVEDAPALDRAVPDRDRFDRLGRKVALMLGVLVAPLDAPATERVLDRLRIHTIDGYRTRTQVFEARDAWATLAAGADDAFLRRLAETTEVGLVAAIAAARSPEGQGRAAEDRAQALGILWNPLPQLILGRDLKSLGLSAGKQMGELLLAVRARQLKGEITTREEALRAITGLLEGEAS